MKRMMIASVVMIAMSMYSNDLCAQVQGRGRGDGRVRTERRESRPGNVERREPSRGGNRDLANVRPPRNNRPRHEVHAHKPGPKHNNHFVPRGGRLVRCAPPRVNRGCYVPGWEGRVRYMNNGHWAYYVDGCWRYYDCYYDPYEFFCEPIPSHVHHSHVVNSNHSSAGEVAAGVVAGTILGCIIGSMSN